MIGVPELDNLSTWDLIRVTWGMMIVRVAIPAPLQVSLDPNESPKLEPPFKLMSNDKIITLCKMEVESRFGWADVVEQIEKQDKDSLG